MAKRRKMSAGSASMTDNRGDKTHALDSNAASAVSEMDLDEEQDESETSEQLDGEVGIDDAINEPRGNNPRIDSEEHWHAHTNEAVVKRLLKIALSHYPERLHKALVVVGHGNTKYTRTAIGGAFTLSKLVDSPRTREKVKFLARYSDLQQYVSRQELVTIVGGTAHVQASAFQCR
jgi:hypothetical protein